MVKIALVQPTRSDRDDWKYYPGNLGISFLSNFLKLKGHEILTLDVNADPSLAAQVLEFSPDYVGVHMGGNNSMGSKLIRIIKTISPKTQIVIGGPSLALDAEGTIRDTSADFGVIGDGIPAMQEIINGNLNALGIARVENGKLIQNGFAHYAVEEWQVDPAVIPVNNSGGYTTITSMGCYGRCSFCDEEKISPRITFRRIESVVQDVEILANTRRVKSLSVLDSNFLMKEGRLAGLVEGLSVKKLPKIHFQARADDILKRRNELAEYKEGIERIEIGVESFIEPQLMRYQKGVSVEQNMAAMDVLRSLGIRARFNLILGDQDIPANEALEECCMITQFFSRHPEYLPFMATVNLRVYDDIRDEKYPPFMKMFWKLYRETSEWINGRERLAREAYFSGKSVPEGNKKMMKSLLVDHFRNVCRVYRRKISSREGYRRTKLDGKYVSLLTSFLFEDGICDWMK